MLENNSRPHIRDDLYNADYDHVEKDVLLVKGKTSYVAKIEGHRLKSSSIMVLSLPETQ